jgi:hypothetical protein
MESDFHYMGILHSIIRKGEINQDDRGQNNGHDEDFEQSLEEEAVDGGISRTRTLILNSTAGDAFLSGKSHFNDVTEEQNRIRKNLPGNSKIV